MHCRCPHCHNPVEITSDDPLSDIECPSCGSCFSLVGDSTLTYTEAESRTIGHFELVDEVGVGAFGSVWMARDTELDRSVAVKIPRKGQLDPQETEQFLREARAAAQLKHPNIVAVHEVGREDGQVYIVSDFVKGITLADRLTVGPFSSHEAAELCAKIADALHHAHESGIIHRDLKPSNIMLDEAGEPHIMDFGLAKREAGEITMTVEGQVLGTPAYMSPEQAKGTAHDANRRSDVYSLGVILYELLTGERPFRGNRRMLLHQVIHEEAPSARKLNSCIPRDLETICLKCLEKEADRRYSTTSELVQELQRFLHGEPILARPVSGITRTWRWCRRKPSLAGFLAVCVVMLLTLAIGGPWIAVQQTRMARQQADHLKQVHETEKARYEQMLFQINALGSTTADNVPSLIETLRLAKEKALPTLRGVFEDERSDHIHRLRAACALASLGNVDRAVWDYLIKRISDAPDEESTNVIGALSVAKAIDAESVMRALWDSGSVAESLSPKSSRASNPYLPRLIPKVRFASTSLHLGETKLAKAMLQLTDDPIFRTVFIDRFPSWRGNLSELAQVAKEVEDRHVRSGICLAVGSIPADELTAGEKLTWETILVDFYCNASDSGTHSAAGWALTQFQVELPKIAPSSQPVGQNEWYVNSVGMRMVKLPAGAYPVASSPMRVSISDREVSVALFQQFIDDPDYPTAEKPKDWRALYNPGLYSRSAAHPENVSWFDAVLFCNWLSYKEGLAPAYRRTGNKQKITVGMAEYLLDEWTLDSESVSYRLPTEAEWEYACRAGTVTRYSIGGRFPFSISRIPFLEKYSLYGVGDVEDLFYAGPGPVASKLPNGWGLFDMHGNVSEWCQDWFTPTRPSERVLRGGDFLFRVYSDSRRGGFPTDRDKHNGFRPARRYR